MIQPDFCKLCVQDDTHLVWRDAFCRVVLVDDADYPGYCRVIWQSHMREMTDLSLAERRYLLDVVCTVERCLRDVLQPEKINLASLGNVIPHLHWHVIPRFASDAHFPNPIWGERLRNPTRGAIPALADALRAALRAPEPEK